MTEPNDDEVLASIQVVGQPGPGPGLPIVHGHPGGRPWTGACHSGGEPLVYCIGALGLDLASESRMDAFAEDMPAGHSPFDVGNVLEYIEHRPWSAASVIWTLNHEGTPIYAVAPRAHEQTGYQQLRVLMAQQHRHEIERVSVPGLLNGTVDLSVGLTVPVIVPDLRGIVGWAREGLSSASWTPEMDAFLDRVFYELRNLGVSPEDRALNYASTRAHVAFSVFERAYQEELVLDAISVEPSPIERPGSDCRDVKLRFFNPGARFHHARREFRITVDVADTLPATIGEVRSWPVY